MTNHYEECDFCGELSHRGEKCKPKARSKAEELLDLLLELPLKERQKLLKK